jgi:hypothetical protein
MVKEKTNRLEINAKYKLSLSILKNFRNFYLIIQSLNPQSLNQHYQDIIIDFNLQASYILCLNETQIINMEVECIVTLTNPKFSVLSCYDGHSIVMFYNANNALCTHEIQKKLY